nr:hypothetical protein [Gordonia sp. LAM0048]
MAAIDPGQEDSLRHRFVAVAVVEVDGEQGDVDLEAGSEGCDGRQAGRLDAAAPERTQRWRL